METIERYSQIVREVLVPLLLRQYSGMDVTNEAVFDEKNDRYLVMSVGWQGRIHRINRCLAHLDIIDGKVWIQQDNTEDGLAYDLGRQEQALPGRHVS